MELQTHRGAVRTFDPKNYRSRIWYTLGLFEKWLSGAGAECLTHIVAIKRWDKEKEGQKNEEGA